MKLNLNKDWTMYKAPMGHTYYEATRMRKEKNDGFACALPSDVRMPLIENGVIRDPVLADYCFESEWIEKYAWWYFKTFRFDEEADNYELIELRLHRIDAHGEIYLNGMHIGSHKNVHRPFIKDINPYIQKGENELAVRVTTGLETVTEEDLSELNWAVCHEGDRCPGRGDFRRAFVRRAQYTIGWDWGPKVVTCGITGDAEIRLYENTVIREVKLSVKSLGEPTVLDVMINIENLDLFATRNCSLSFRMSRNGKVCTEKNFSRELLTSGYNYIRFEAELPNAEIWWPNGYGAQPLYDVSVSAVCMGVKTEYPSFRYGVRTVKLDVSPLHEEGEERLFTWVVNDTPIFCKGGDWIPSDSIYARVSDQKYETLIREAVHANFNALRVWGGGLYESDVFYELCDQYGILLWQDFMFACSTYPDHRESFREEVRREMDYQTKRLRNHPCIGIFCGNNEDHEIFYQTKEKKRWGLDYSHEKQYGLYTSNILAKEIIHANCPEIPYWNSSPYGGTLPFGETAGDVHYWGKAMMSPDMENRINPFVYDKITAKFVSEYGYIGPCTLDSVKEYFDGRPVERTSAIWKHHNNAFEKHTVLAGIEKHYGLKPENLSLEDYLYYAGAVHGLILGYSLEAIRFKNYCAGAIFWMYNDTWGEVGWTIVDYYLRRKIGYYGVKRAFLPQKVSMRLIDGEVVIQLCNDCPEAIDIPAQYGYISFDGKVRKMKQIRLTAQPRSRAYILREPLPDCDFTKGAMVIIPAHTLEPASLYMTEHKNRVMPKAEVKILACEPVGSDMLLTLQSEVFAHHVTIRGDFKFSDNYFDLLPGEIRKVTVYNASSKDWTVTSIL